MLKVALIDNMNNSFFAFTRYLRDEGVDAHLFCIKGENSHFEPHADTFKDVDTLDYIHFLPFKPSNRLKLMIWRPSLKKLLNDFDLIIASGGAIGFLELENITIDLVIPYGSDLYANPFKTFNSKSPISSAIRAYMAEHQKKGLQKARVMVMDRGFTLYRTALDKLQIKSYISASPMVYNRELEDTSIHLREWDFLDDHDFIVFNHSRQWWKSKVDAQLEDFETYGGAKRNDKVIKAFAEFLKTTRFKKPLLVLFEYGPDYQASKELIHDLKIEGQIKWMPISFRKNIMYGLSKATFATNAFRENLAGIGGVSNEALACGVALINNMQGLDSPAMIFASSAIIHAVTEDEIRDIFIDYENNPEKYKAIAKQSKKWFDDTAGRGLAKKYVKLLTLLASDKTITQEDSRVREIFANQ